VSNVVQCRLGLVPVPSPLEDWSYSVLRVWLAYQRKHLGNPHLVLISHSKSLLVFAFIAKKRLSYDNQAVNPDIKSYS